MASNNMEQVSQVSEEEIQDMLEGVDMVVESEAENEGNEDKGKNKDGSKRVSILQKGLEQMRDGDVLTTCKTLLDQSIASVTTEDEKFDALVLNVPWKTVTPEFLQSVPVNSLLRDDNTTAVLLWVDSPHVRTANRLIENWGLEYHSVLQSLTYANAPILVPQTQTRGTNTTPETSENETAAATETNEEVPDDSTVGTIHLKAVSSRKSIVPTGWDVDGIVPTYTRQLWLCYKAGSSIVDNVATALARVFREPHVLRKKLGSGTSSFIFPEPSPDATVYAEGTEVTGSEAAPTANNGGAKRASNGKGKKGNTSSSTKKRLFEHYQMYPEFAVYLPPSVYSTLGAIFRPSARVLTLFADTLSREGFTWGPNVPGYLAAPLRTDGGLPVHTAISKYFTSTKSSTLDKYLSLINCYANQMARSLVNSDAAPPSMPANLARIQEFIADTLRRAQQGGGFASGHLANIVPLNTSSLQNFETLPASLKAQFLLLIGHAIRIVRNNTSGTARRRRSDKGDGESGSSKRRRTTENGGGAEGNKGYGIAAPVTISTPLASFLKLGSDTKIARTAVVKLLNDYIKSHGLQNPEMKTQILLDDPLRDLLRPPAEFGPVTYFNLSRLLDDHFPPNVAQAAPAEPVA